MFNEAGETLGFGKAAEILLEIAHASSPDEIVRRLVETAEDWAGDRRTTMLLLSFYDSTGKIFRKVGTDAEKLKI
jgi:hypothetical protein